MRAALGSLWWNLPYAPVMAWTLLLWVVLPRRVYALRSEVPEARPLEDHWEDVLAEALDLLADRDAIPAFHEVVLGQERLSYQRRWRTYVLRLYGVDVAAARRRCPRTAALIDQVPTCYTALFSVLEPGARLPLHGGPLKAAWRYHLPLVVPEGDCGLRVAGIERRWVPGRPLVFDDTLPHTAWNNTDEPRVLLFVDLLRPMPNRRWERVNAAVLGALSRSPRIRRAVLRADGLA